jgi:tRNA(Ile)-lysidine synthetase-like protein
VGKRLELSGGRSLRSGRQELFLEMETTSAAGETLDYELDYEYVLPVPGVVKVTELAASIEASVVQPGAVPEEDRGQLLYLGRMPKQVVIRNWRAGDRFWPAHTAEEKKVKELLSDRHATGAEKKLWPVAVAEGCGIVWIRGFPVPAAFRAPMRTPKAIWIREITGMM